MKINNKGATLVEVTCGFLMLVVAMTAFIKIIDLSSRLTDAAVSAKKAALEYDRLYYNGYNFQVTVRSEDKYIFREDMDVPNASSPIQISLVEWEKDEETGYFTEWKPDADGKFGGSSRLEAPSLTMSETKLKNIENIWNDSATKLKVYRYVREVAPSE